MHSVCVCKKHQNAKLLILPIPRHKEYNECLSKMACSLENKKCMMNLCEKWPGKKDLKSV